MEIELSEVVKLFESNIFKKAHFKSAYKMIHLFQEVMTTLTAKNSISIGRDVPKGHERNNTLHKFWDPSPSTHYQCRLQISEIVSWKKLSCCNSSDILQGWVGRSGLICFCKVSNSRIFRIFSGNWLGLNDLCEIWSQNLRELTKYNW